ncbi:WD repeat and HMG-box DNA-binding protein 1 [Dorcoceras hygrometricum]|uniref:WD repeat and HMG-box DNA-binding protein 1 n=1 Tax=Dorcoceras hygrometricum TaxID=472368 RepID=A0A2Z6ZVM2_9LAMI|nr:WD repeat and HMG-box DNA-binding protein 1 [Dorcoceras hygrometricum]
MSLFDLQDVRIAIGSIATLDLPMVVDLIGYGLKGPYCTLTTTNWFLQALSVIPRGSWAMLLDALTMIRWATAAPSLLQKAADAALVRRRHVPSEFVLANLDEENPSAPISSGLLVQADEGVSYPVMDRIDVIYRRLP